MPNNWATYLNEISSKNKIASVYSDPDNLNRFAAGFVEFVGSNQLLLKSISPLGTYDGYLILRIEDILRIDVDTMYSKKLQFLFSTNEKKQRKIMFPKIVKKNTNLFSEMIKNSKQHRFVINISIVNIYEHESVLGFVKEILSKSVIVDRFDLNGNSDGESLIRINDIRKMFCDAEDERLIGMFNGYMKNDMTKITRKI